MLRLCKCNSLNFSPRLCLNDTLKISRKKGFKFLSEWLKQLFVTSATTCNASLSLSHWRKFQLLEWKSNFIVHLHEALVTKLFMVSFQCAKLWKIKRATRQKSGEFFEIRGKQIVGVLLRLLKKLRGRWRKLTFSWGNWSRFSKLGKSSDNFYLL